MTRSPLGLSICGFCPFTPFGGFAAREAVEAKPKTPNHERPLENPEPKKKDDASAVEKHKIFLNRLLTELQRSPRSFIYLRSIGFTETDQQFEKLITENSAI